MVSPERRRALPAPDFVPQSWMNGEAAAIGLDWVDRINPQPKRRTNARSYKVYDTMPPEIVDYLASGRDIRHNRNLMTADGARRWAAKNRNRMFAMEDRNMDGVPEMYLAYDKDNDGLIDRNEVTHVDGYYVGQANRPLQMRYEQDRMLNPEGFRRAKMTPRKYNEILYNAQRDPVTGEVSYDKNAVEAYEDMLKRTGQKVMRPKSETLMNVWKRNIFKPVYDCVMSFNGDGRGIVLNDSYQKITMDGTLGYIMLGAKAYHYLVTSPILRGILAQKPGLNEHQIKALQSKKEFKEAVRNVIYDHLENIGRAWQEVYNFINLVIQRFPAARNHYEPAAATNLELISRHAHYLRSEYEKTRSAMYSDNFAPFANVNDIPELEWSNTTNPRAVERAMRQRTDPYAGVSFDDDYGAVTHTDWNQPWNYKADSAAFRNEYGHYGRGLRTSQMSPEYQRYLEDAENAVREKRRRNKYIHAGSTPVSPFGSRVPTRAPTPVTSPDGNF